MAADSPWKAARWRSRMARTGMALMMSALLPAQVVAQAAPLSPGSGTVTPPAVPQAEVFSYASSQTATAKIDARVAESFKGGGQVTYLVKMRAQADVKGAAQAARSQASPATATVMARGAVIESLREAAQVSQAGILSELANAQSKGSVSKYESFWITNMIAVTSTEDVMKRLSQRADVEMIVEDGPIHLVDEGKAPATALVEPTAGATGAPGVYSVEWNIQRIGAPAVWSQFGIDGAGAVVASLDTGVAGDHEALHDKFRGYNPADGGVNPVYSWFDAVNSRTLPYDDHGHGTHTTGTMVGSDPAGANQIGVAPGAQWIAAKILSSSGSGTAQNILRAGEWVLAPGGDPSKAPDVVNNSWGGGPGMDEWFRGVVQAWRAAGIVPVFAGGNDGPGAGTIGEPSNYPESIAVGATDSADNLASFSSRGPSPYGEVKPEVAAPGVNIRSAVPNGSYESGWNGTSMATPHVAGTVALLRQANAALTVDEIETVLTSAADPKTDSTYTDLPNNGYGHGILNAYTAVGMVATGIGTVSGRVLTGGDDLDPAVITHTPVAQSFKGIDTAIVADIADNVGVTAAYLRFRTPGMSWWGIVDLTRTSGDHRSGRYVAVIPAEIAQGDSLEYYLQADDYGGSSTFHGTQAAPHVVQLQSGITPGYSQDFEAGAVGWTHGGAVDSWEIGVPTSGPNEAHSGAQVAATNLEGDYPDNHDGFLISPPIDLSAGPAAARFWHWYSTENNYDKAYVLATGDAGQNWSILGQYTSLSGGWRDSVVDLSAFGGNPQVFVAFLFTSDGSVTRPGWYIDDFELYVDAEAPAAPASLTAQATPAGSIALTWDGVTAGDLAHYNVYRSETAGGPFSAIGRATQPGFVDTETAAGVTYFYVVTAVDVFGNESGYSNEAQATPASAVVLFQDDMEAGPGSWTHSGENDPWQHGAPTSGPNGASSGTSVWATNLSGNYASSTNASLLSPPIDLTGMGAASLQFAHWYSLERNYDFGRVEITSDGGTSWTQLAQYSSPASGGQPVGWESPLIDLTDYAGQTIQIRFRLQSDSSVNYPGWYVDDVRVAGVPDAGTGVNLSLSVSEEPVELKGEKPAEPTSFQVPLPKSAATYRVDDGKGSSTDGIGINALPMAATITVVETGRVVRTSPVDGSYRITLPAGTYSLRAECYGYYPQTQSVTIADGQSATLNFMMEEVPHGQITGTLTDRRTGAPIEGATVLVVEDPMIPAATTDASGHFSLDVLVGTYTVKARHSRYYPGETTVTISAGAAAIADMALTPFVGMDDEIGYDDGSAENAWAWRDTGNAWAVRMTPEIPGQPVQVTGARFYLWDSSWPSPGGNRFKAAIYGANADGTPGALLAGPLLIENAIRGGWNEVDFSQAGVTVTGDFYVAYIQEGANPNIPGMAVDESTPASGRNWQMVGGGWSEWTDTGNFMIRAKVRTAVGTPTITAPADNSFTNDPALTVEGKSIPGTLVTLYVDGTEAGQATADGGGTWSVALTLTEGAHALTATATVAGTGPGSGTTDPSAPVTITLDTQAPVVSISAPVEGAQQNHRLITVSGQVSDDHLDGITVNGQAAPFNADGTFSMEIIGQDGLNTIVVTAADRAGNTASAERSITVDPAAPDLTNLQPAADQTLRPGDSLTLSFDSEAGLALAAYQIVVDTSAAGAAGSASTLQMEPGEAAMAETSPGHYEATWTVPEDMNVARALVQFRAVDAAGNAARVTAPGALQIGAQSELQAVITGPDTGRAKRSLQYDASQSIAPDGIASYQWDMGDGKVYTTSAVTHKYRRAGTYTITLTITDATGATSTATKTVTISR